MKLSVEDIVQLIDKEILWCERNPDKALHSEYSKGFVNGLLQAKYLIGELQQQVRNKS
jgi:hypothetical protein